MLFGEISNETNIPGYGKAGSGIRFRKAGMPTETYGDYEPIVYATNNAGDIGSGSFMEIDCTVIGQRKQITYTHALTTS